MLNLGLAFTGGGLALLRQMHLPVHFRKRTVQFHQLLTELGLDKDAQSVSAFGAREIAAGSGLLSPVRPGPWLWMRVGGDLMDAFALRTAVNRDNPRRRIAIAATGVLGLIAIVDFALAFHASTHRRENEQAAA